MRTSESVEQLSIDVISLGRKVFPKICEAEFDRILKGRFFQALLPKWQRKLGTPKIDEKLTTCMIGHVWSRGMKSSI